MANQVDLSIMYVADPTIGRPVSNGSIYVGIVDLDPKIVGNQKQISVLQENGTTVEVGQPISTSAGGVPLYNGSPVTILVDGSYSLRVDDKHGDQAYYVPRNAENAESFQSIENISDLRATSYTPDDNDNITVVGYYAPGDGGGGQFYWDSTSTATDNGGTIIKITAIATGRYIALGADSEINIKRFGIFGTDATADTAQFIELIAAYPNGVKVISSDQTLNFNGTLAIPENFHIDLGGSTVFFDARGKTNIQFGFLMASNTSIRNISQGYILFDHTLYDNFITCGLFYGSGGNRASYVGSVPDISSATDSSIWDAPTDVEIDNIHSDVSGVSKGASDYFGVSFVFITNFSKRITVNNITAKGFAEYSSYAASYVSSGAGILNETNYYNVVRFEWGNLTTPTPAIAAGESLKISNIYGEGLRLHNHSGVVSMGNAFSFEVSNISGKETGQVFFAGTSGVLADTDDSVKAFVTSMRSVKNIKGSDLYVFDEGGHLCAGINITDIWYGTTALSPHNSLSINGFTLIGRDLDATAPTNYPGHGILLGDSTWSADTRFIDVKNGRVSKFNDGMLYSDARNINTENVVCSYNGTRGLSISSSTLIQSRMSFKNCYYMHNNLDGEVDYAVNLGVGATIFRGMGVTFDNCTFGDGDVAAGSETQLHSVFLRDGEVRNITFRDCSFPNYESASSYDIWSNSASITYNIDNCLGSIETDGRLKTNRLDVAFGFDLLATGKFNYSGAVLNKSNFINCDMSRTSTGRYLATFDKALISTDYFVIPISSGDIATHNYYTQYSNIASSGFEILVRTAAGALVDPTSLTQDIGFLVVKSNDITQQINP